MVVGEHNDHVYKFEGCSEGDLFCKKCLIKIRKNEIIDLDDILEKIKTLDDLKERYLKDIKDIKDIGLLLMD